MNRDMVKGHWQEMKGKIKQQWGKLTDDDIAMMTGTYDELQGKLQKEYGYQKEEAKQHIDRFLDDNGWNDDRS